MSGINDFTSKLNRSILQGSRRKLIGGANNTYLFVSSGENAINASIHGKKLTWQFFGRGKSFLI
jgi:hypothetical protein